MSEKIKELETIIAENTRQINALKVSVMLLSIATRISKSEKIRQTLHNLVLQPNLYIETAQKQEITDPATLQKIEKAVKTSQQRLDDFLKELDDLLFIELKD